jgi:hypothetical protein
MEVTTMTDRIIALSISLTTLTSLAGFLVSL